MSPIYRNQLRECSRCGRWVPKGDVVPAPGFNGKRCVDRVRCATHPPLYDTNEASNQAAEFGLLYLAACKWCGAMFTPAGFRALGAARADDLQLSQSDTHESLSKECCCGNRIVRRLRRVLPC